MNTRSSQAGVSLIEVLIAVVLLALGLIGIAGLQTSAISNNQISSQYTQAALLAQNMAERMRGNRDAVVNNDYLQAAGAVGNPAKNCYSATCTSTEQAKWDLAVWYASVAANVSLGNVPDGPKANLPGAQVAITCAAATCDQDAVRMITVYWDADRSGVTGTGCDATNDSDLRCFRLPFLP